MCLAIQVECGKSGCDRWLVFTQVVAHRAQCLPRERLLWRVICWRKSNGLLKQRICISKTVSGEDKVARFLRQNQTFQGDIVERYCGGESAVVKINCIQT